MLLKILLVQIFTVILIFKTDAANILAYFPATSISHQVVFRPLTQELAKRGHQVTIITPNPAFPNGEAPPNITEIDLHEKSYEMWRDSFSKNVDGESKNAFDVVRKSLKRMVDIVEYQIKSKEVSEILKSKQFDLVLVEAFMRPGMILSHFVKAPMILISSFGSVFFNNEALGAPSHLILYPEVMRKRIYNLSIWEKLNGLKEEYEYREMYWSLEKYENAMLKKTFGPDTPTVAELQNNVDMLFLNINPIWEDNRPVPPNVIHMGGLHQQPFKELPVDLKTYLDSSKHGVIYMSFGTNVDPGQLPNERIQIFCKVFSRLQYDVLWKWNADELPGKPKNVRISKWLPQLDLLRHPKIKLFITQGGLQSTDESITAGVPLIAFPMLGDQWYNAEKYVYHKIGLKMDLPTLTEESLEKSIKEVIDNPSYRKNVKRLGDLMRDQPQSPLERAVWWTEYVLRHGGAKYLRSPAANISWTEYLMLDVLSIFLGFLSLAFLILACGIYVVCKFFGSNVVRKRKLKTR